MFKYDPLQKSNDEIESTFIIGKKYLEDILNRLEPKDGSTSNQCIIISGNRGIGKSHFLRMLYLRILKNNLLKQYYSPILYPEELFSVNSLYHLLVVTIKRIFDQIKKSGGINSQETKKLKKEFDDLCKVRFSGKKEEKDNKRIEIENKFFNIINKLYSYNGKKYILLLENLQQLFGNQLSQRDLKRLRGYMQENPDTILIIGSAVAIFDAVENYGEPFYNFFIWRKLTGVNQNEVIDFLKKQASVRNDPEIINKIDNYKSEIEVFRILTGGNPRLILFIYDLLKEKDELFTNDILKKITELTPYFKDKTEKLSGVQKLIIGELCCGMPAKTPSEIANNVNKSVGVISETLKRLKTEGKLRKVDLKSGQNIKSSETFYNISDYFYRIWYQIRQSVSVEDNLSWMAELAVLLLDKEQLQERTESKNLKLRPVYEKALELSESTSFVNRISQLKEVSETYGESYEVKLYEMFKNAEWKNILEITEQMIEKKEKLGIAYFYRAIVHSSNEKRDYQKSIKLFKKAVEIRDDYLEAWNNMGNVYVEMGKYKDAIESYKKAVEIRYDWPDAWFNVGYAYTEMGKYKDAIESYKKAVKIKDDHPEAWYNLGDAYANIEKFNKVLPAYKSFIKTSVKYEAFNIQAYNAIKSICDQFINESESLEKITDKNSTLKTKLLSIGELIIINKFNGVENIVDNIFKKVEGLKLDKIPVPELKVLYFYLMFETILRLNNKSGEKNPVLSARYFLRTSCLLKNNRNLQEMISEFIINYLKNTDKSDIDIEGLQNIFDEWEKMDVRLPESVTSLSKAIQDPDSRTAQVWSTDPLFREIVEMLKSDK
ncbi:MAG: tetratricopeptide repeat protein [Candidatus Marinimicrobia bacterium]|nr:tetratricopeptide repeat protein [Candidatus Neomarinimicrobiota bacterium]